MLSPVHCSLQWRPPSPSPTFYYACAQASFSCWNLAGHLVNFGEGEQGSRQSSLNLSTRSQSPAFNITTCSGAAPCFELIITELQVEGQNLIPFLSLITAMKFCKSCIPLDKHTCKMRVRAHCKRIKRRAAHSDEERLERLPGG